LPRLKGMMAWNAADRYNRLMQDQARPEISLSQMTVVIEPMSKRTVSVAIELADRIFLYQTWWRKARFIFLLSLMKGILPKLIFGVAGVAWCEHWVATNPTGEVLGVTGLYSLLKDPDAYYLSWTFVNPNFRRCGVGDRLVSFALEQARSQGAKYLKLDTWDLPMFESAHRLYKRHGFQITHKKPGKRKDISYNILYFQAPL
jgi:GNAT superfamily N-acetyltransferase